MVRARSLVWLDKSQGSGYMIRVVRLWQAMAREWGRAVVRIRSKTCLASHSHPHTQNDH